MSSRSTLARTLAGALAIAALAAPAALARPALDQPAGGTTPQTRSVQNLRSPDAEDAATRTDQKTAAALAQARYYASYGEPAPVQQPASSVSADDGTDWTLIAAGLAALLIVGSSATMAGRARLRTRRAAAA